MDWESVVEHRHDEASASGEFVLSGQVVVEYQVRLVDLDLKTPKLAYWHDLDTRIRGEYQGVTNPRICNN